MKLKWSFLFLFSLLTIKVAAQSNFNVPGSNRISISDSDRTIRAGVLESDKKTRTKDDRYYYWVKGTHIHRTRGAYEGKLLDGPYKAFYADKSLEEAGNFQHGLKDGLWKSWNPAGEYKIIVTWRKGKKNGKFNLFDEHGKLLREGQYKDDLLDGEIKDAREEGKSDTSYYKAGKIISKPRFNEQR